MALAQILVPICSNEYPVTTGNCEDIQSAIMLKWPYFYSTIVNTSRQPCFLSITETRRITTNHQCSWMNSMFAVQVFSFTFSQLKNSCVTGYMTYLLLKCISEFNPTSHNCSQNWSRLESTLLITFWKLMKSSNCFTFNSQNLVRSVHAVSHLFWLTQE